MWDDGASRISVLALTTVFHIFHTTCGRSIHIDEHLVVTKLGAIRGIEQKFEGTSVSAYLGVPYAKPPIGNRRFGKPEMVEKWSGELEARKPARTCFYTVDKMFPDFPGAEMWNPPPSSPLSEDCLSLNLWVPPHHDGSVFVWIYGGGFFSGSPSLDLYDGSVLAARNNKIVVDINYRLGPFGFLYLGDESDIPGNMGLLDQQLALRWVHENIGAFGGDASRITLLGESAGAASVTAHLLAPDSQQYFQRIIANSGTITNTWATRTKEALFETTLQLAKLVNCTDATSTTVDKRAIERCLRRVPAPVLQTEADNLNLQIRLPPMTFPFTPVDEDVNFFKGNIFEKIRRRDFKKDVSVILGTVQDEGTYWLPYYMSEKQYGFHFNHTISSEDPQNRALINKAQFAESMHAFMPYFGNSPLVEHALQHAYKEVSKSEVPQERLRDGVARFLGDYFFTCGVIDFADILADNVFGPVYMYYFTARSSFNPWPKWMGAMHGYEIEYVFGLPMRRPNLYDKDKLPIEVRFSEIVMNLWVNFANTGTPSSYWPKYNRVTRTALILSDELTTGVHRLKLDPHGTHCRLLEESKAVAGQLSGVECRTRRTGPQAVISSSSTSLPTMLMLSVIVMRFLTS